ncbi:unnamed protein product [marine sediment metagenome]|uniref:Methyltransferase FkbM domain-containing protein n=1 Tax=marine sediment metagenome TaxID=412755 RepID=X1N8V4_9ZZZZ
MSGIVTTRGDTAIPRELGHRRIFIDCGAHCGCSMKQFQKTIGSSAGKDYEIHSFECNPEFAPLWVNASEANSNVHFHNAAVWTNNGTMDFFLCTVSTHDGSSLLKEKKTGEINKTAPVTVETVDLNAWLRENALETDEIILKLDIEGAEYAVLEHLFNEGSLQWVNRLLIEWHWHKVGISKQEHDRVVSLVYEAGVSLDEKEWCAQEHCVAKYKN